MKFPSLLMLVMASAIAPSSGAEVETYLGLNEFRHIKADLKAKEGECISNPWEDGNFFINADAKRLLIPNTDTIAVKLKAAYFDYAPETSVFFKQKMTVQVGIFADISPKGSAMAAPGSAGIPGRLVFFSADQQLGQRRIPDINTNVYGPVLYTGGGLGFKFSLLEFDQAEGDKLADSLLKSIADLGTQASSGVPGYLQGPLSSLFQAAFASAKSKDDLFGQITFVLDDRNGSGNAATSPLRTGDIAFVRQSDRTKPIPWANLCYKPATGEIFTGSEKTPTLSYVVISIVKNAGADAGRIQDALTYERFATELAQRNSSSGIVTSVEEITSALKDRATERELFRRIGVMELDNGSISKFERFEAASHLSKVLYASGLRSKGFDSSAIAANPDCAYLTKERLRGDDLPRLLMRLQQGNENLTRQVLEPLYATAPNSCAAANDALQKIQDKLLNP